MIGLGILILIAGLILFVGIELVNINVCGFPPKDEDVLEFIQKVRNSEPYLLDGAKPNSMLCSNGHPYISNSLRTCLFGCYISDVGTIPRWYKSYDEIQKLYTELGAENSKTKREKLGL